jgi:type II secretory pathway pseudopilin PulG
MKLRTRRIYGLGPIGKRLFPAAFTFAEVLAALVFMAIVIPVAMQGLQIANRAGVVAERKSMAARLADRLLNEHVVIGTWSNAGQSGTLLENGKEFRWRLLNEPWIENAMRLITVEVTYLVQNQEYRVLVSTLVKETSL